MKMTKAQKVRLKALLAMDATKLTADEISEYNTLKGLAVKENFDAASYDPDADNEGEQLTDEQVKSLVEESLTKVLKSVGLSTDAIVAKVKELNATAVTASKIEEIVKANAGGKDVDTKAIVDAVKAGLPATITEEKIKEIFEESMKAHRRESKMEYDISFPIAHRSGNLTVAQKQLLNICLMHSGNPDLADKDRPKHMNDGITEDQLAKAARRGEMAVKSLRESLRYGAKAVTTGNVGYGAELIDTDLSSDLQRRLYLDSQLASILISSEIQMPTNPFQLPMLTTRPSFFVTAETQSAIGSDPGTAAPTLNAKKLVGMTPYSYEADEDSIVAILPVLQEALAAGAADAFEYAVINGDTSATHFDSDIDAVTRHAAKAFNGLRKMVRGVSGLWLSFATGGVTAQNIAALRKLLKKYGIQPRDLALIVGPSAWNDLVQLEEVLTADKQGAGGGTINSGTLPKIFGVDIVVSAACREDLDSTGVYDPAGTKSAMFLIHKPSFIVGVRRGFTVEVDVDRQAQVNYVIASFRRDFIAKETPSAAQPLVAGAYNF